ncbi:unnamed protein product, partial [Ectocarpus sp. 12 AP-2014]
ERSGGRRATGDVCGGGECRVGTFSGRTERRCPVPYQGGVVLLPAGAVPPIRRVATGSARVLLRAVHVGGPVVRPVSHLLPP